MADEVAARFGRRGGRSCLDFANTVNWRGTPAEEELLPGPADLLAWAREFALLPHPGDPGDTGPVDAAGLDAARRLREAIYAVFSALAAGAEPPPAALRTLERAHGRALRHAHLVPPDRASSAADPADPAGRGGADGGDTELVWSWDGVRAAAGELVAWRVALDAVDLLRSPARLRVRECADGRCGWLFLDRSRNSTRRWCNSAGCGNRTRVRRYYQRQRRGLI